MHSLMTIPASGIPQTIAAARIGAAPSARPVRKAHKVLRVPEVRLAQEDRKGPRAFPAPEV